MGWEVVMQKREYPDFRFSGVGISAASSVRWLMASRHVPMDIYVVVDFLSQVFVFFFCFKFISNTLKFPPPTPHPAKKKLPDIKYYLQHTFKLVYTFFTEC